eukprot:Sdes_comp20033_c0_seq1m12820
MNSPVDSEQNRLLSAESGENYGSETGLSGADKIDILSVKYGTVWSSIGNLTATTMGAGILSLPVSFAYTGYFTGTLLLVMFAVFSDYSLVLLVKSARLCGAASLEELGFHCFGRVGAFAVKTVLMMLLFGFLIVSVIVVSDSMYPLYRDFLLPLYHPLHAWFASKAFVSLLSIGLMFPLALSRTLSGLRFTSWLAVFSVVYLIFVMVSKFTARLSVSPSASGFQFSSKFAMALPIQSVAFCSQFNIIPLFDEMKVSERPLMNKVIHISILGMGLTGYLLFGVLGYLYFGKEVDADILMQFDSEPIITIARLGIGLNLICKFPLVIMPFRNVLNDWLYPDHPFISNRFIFVETLAIVSLVYLMSLFLGELANAFALVGSTAGICVCFILPALFYQKLSQVYGISLFDRVMCRLMILIGLVSGIVGFGTTLMTLFKYL